MVHLMFRFHKQLRNVLEILMMSEVNIKVFKDNPNFVSSFLYYVPTHPLLFWPLRLTIFQNPWTSPFNLTPHLLWTLVRVDNK